MRVALFVTCLVDLFRPSVGHAAVKLLELAECDVVIPPEQTCCGQPAYNNGDRKNAQRLARRVIDDFGHYDYIVVPSGSCAGMIKCHYPALLADDPTYHARALQLTERCYELTSFLIDVAGIKINDVSFNKDVTYHDSCSCQRELSIKAQPRELLKAVTDLRLNEMQGTEECCGFGGTFCVKYDELSANMVDSKVNNIQASGASVLLAADMGCLMNIAGRIKRRELPVKVYHIAEVLADLVLDDGIGGA
ncbi:(Fe-S)-binding protein [Kaarinaea lacus]